MFDVFANSTWNFHDPAGAGPCSLATTPPENPHCFEVSLWGSVMKRARRDCSRSRTKAISGAGLTARPSRFICGTTKIRVEISRFTQKSEDLGKGKKGSFVTLCGNERRQRVKTSHGTSFSFQDTVRDAAFQVQAISHRTQ